MKSEAVPISPVCRWDVLAEVAQVYRGRGFSRCSAGAIPFIQGRNLRVEKICIGDLDSRDICPLDPRIIRTELGDILLQKLGDAPAAYLISQDEAGIAISDTVFLIRMRTPNFRYGQFLTAFFNSTSGRRHLTDNICAAVVKTQSLQHLTRLQIPRPSCTGIELFFDACARENIARQELAHAVDVTNNRMKFLCAPPEKTDDPS